MSEQVFSSLLAALSERVDELRYSTILATIRAAVEGDSSLNHYELFYAALSLHDFSDRLERRNIVADIVETLEASGIFAENKADSAKIFDRLNALRNVTNLVAIAKGVRLLVRNERNYHYGLMLTDTRHVFSENVEDGIMAAVIVHQLEIQYNGEGGKFFVELDEQDIDDLQVVLARAKAKATAIKGQLELSKTPYITTNRW